MWRNCVLALVKGSLLNSQEIKAKENQDLILLILVYCAQEKLCESSGSHRPELIVLSSTGK